MLEVKFYDTVPDDKLKFAVILSKTRGKWVFCRHRERTTYEIPGGHREIGENILDTAKRELYEETGAIKYSLYPIGAYSVADTVAEESFGMFYYADIEEFEKELHSEIEEIIITEDLPGAWTYPLIQPKLMEYAKKAGFF
ncbi:NUDIX hydrolase [Anaerocolumna jejuensis]|uniref:NUDIX hydrolase n=1 Tax=Anaerocolumna jejuensis TaxID=259063 RepID=UPI003F7BAC1D